MGTTKMQDVGLLVKQDLESEDYKSLSHIQKKLLVAYAQASCNVSKACDIAGHSRMSWYNFFNQIPLFKEVAENIQEMDLDLAESQLNYLIKGQYILRKNEKGEVLLDEEGEPIREYINPIDTTAVIFKLKTQGKKRGYTYRTEVTGAEGQPLGGFKITIKNKKDRNGSNRT